MFDVKINQSEKSIELLLFQNETVIATMSLSTDENDYSQNQIINYQGLLTKTLVEKYLLNDDFLKLALKSNSHLMNRSCELMTMMFNIIETLNEFRKNLNNNDDFFQEFNEKQ